MKNNFLMLVASICLISLTIMYYIQMDVGRYVPTNLDDAKNFSVLDTKTGRLFFLSEGEVIHKEFVGNSKPAQKKNKLSNQ